MVDVDVLQAVPATRLSPDDPWVRWAVDSLGHTTGKEPAVLLSCSQQDSQQHLLGSVAREGLRIMAGLFWDLGEHPPGVDR
jgi:hypothetical protein